MDRLSVRLSQHRTLDPQHLQRAVALRHERCTLRRIARLLPLPLSTVGAPSTPLAWALETLEATGAGTALPVGQAWRHDQRPHQTAGHVRSRR